MSHEKKIEVGNHVYGYRLFPNAKTDLNEFGAKVEVAIITIDDTTPIRINIDKSIDFNDINCDQFMLTRLAELADYISVTYGSNDEDLDMEGINKWIESELDEIVTYMISRHRGGKRNEICVTAEENESD